MKYYTKERKKEKKITSLLFKALEQSTEVASLKEKKRKFETHEAISLALAGVSVCDHDCLFNGSELVKEPLQGVVGGVVGQSSHEDLRQGGVSVQSRHSDGVDVVKLAVVLLNCLARCRGVALCRLKVQVEKRVKAGIKIRAKVKFKVWVEFGLKRLGLESRLGLW